MHSAINMGSQTMEFNADHDGFRWVAYFDLLGTSKIITDKKYLRVFSAYQQALEQLERRCESHSQVKYSWFSDTFLLATIVCFQPDGCPHC